jgi:hypothetical protein
MAWWSTANALHAFARGASELRSFRFLLGLGESGNFMAAEKAISEWFPAKERGFANGLVNAAAATGAIMSPPLIAWVTLAFGWRFAFAVTGLLGFVWLVAWLLLYGTPPVPSEKRPRVPYGELLRMPAVWGLMISRIFADPVWWFYLFWLPKYLSDVRHFSMVEIGLIAWMPYLSADLGSLFGGWMSGPLHRSRLCARGCAALDHGAVRAVHAGWDCGELPVVDPGARVDLPGHVLAHGLEDEPHDDDQRHLPGEHCRLGGRCSWFGQRTGWGDFNAAGGPHSRRLWVSGRLLGDGRAASDRDGDRAGAG